MTITRFFANSDQLAKMIALVINASRPAGMGRMHYRPSHIFEPKDVAEIDYKLGYPGLSYDYVEGRMVKMGILCVRAEGEETSKFDGVRFNRIKPPIIPNLYELNVDVPHIDYQSWAWKYPTIESLMIAAGFQRMDESTIRDCEDTLSLELKTEGFDGLKRPYNIEYYVYNETN